LCTEILFTFFLSTVSLNINFLTFFLNLNKQKNLRDKKTISILDKILSKLYEIPTSESVIFYTSRENLNDREGQPENIYSNHLLDT